MSDKKTPEPNKAPEPPKPIDQSEHGRFRKPHGSAPVQPKE